MFSLGYDTNVPVMCLGVYSQSILTFGTLKFLNKFSFFGHVMVQMYTNFTASQKAQFAYSKQILQQKCSLLILFNNQTLGNVLWETISIAKPRCSGAIAHGAHDSVAQTASPSKVSGQAFRPH